jgi:DNA-binding CsgD family transcriptional regulator
MATINSDSLNFDMERDFTDVPLVQVCRIYGLLDDCRRLGDDCRLWLEKLVGGLQSLLDADGGNAAQFCTAAPEETKPNGVAKGKYSLTDAEFFLDRSDRSYMLQFGQELASGMPDGAGQTVVMQVAGTATYADQITALSRIRGGACDIQVLHVTRTPQRPPFDRRDVATMLFLAQLFGRAVGDSLAGFRERRPSELPPRVQEVLGGLLRGEGDKQIAQRLRISRHTVNQYVKLLYAYFDVKSRAELMSRWIKRGWQYRL